MNTAKRIAVNAAGALTLALLIGSVSAAKLYKWVDADGNISYQDSPPPNNAKVLEESELTISRPNSNDDSDVEPLVVYTLEDCNSCEMLILRLRQLDIPFVEQSLLDRDVQSQILSESDSLTAPTVRIGTDYINQFSEPGFIAVLRQAGYTPNLGTAANEQPASGEPPE